MYAPYLDAFRPKTSWQPVSTPLAQLLLQPQQCQVPSLPLSIHDIKPTYIRMRTSHLTLYIRQGRGSTYTLNCGIELLEAVHFGDSALDLMGVYVYTFTDCVNACATYNDNSMTCNQPREFDVLCRVLSTSPWRRTREIVGSRVIKRFRSTAIKLLTVRFWS